MSSSIVKREGESASTLAPPNDERRFGIGLAVVSLAVGGMIAAASLIWPTVIHPVALFALCGAGLLIGLTMMVHAGRTVTHPQPNLPIALAVEYLVNDSQALLEQNAPPEIATFGPAKGQLVIEQGRPNQDALVKIEEQLGFGTLTAFGREAATSGENPSSFDSVLRIIPQDYWKVAGLHGLFARVHSSSCAQTYKRVEGHPLYGDVRLDRRQVRAMWKPKPLWRRLWERRILRRQRITDYLFTETPDDAPPPETAYQALLRFAAEVRQRADDPQPGRSWVRLAWWRGWECRQMFQRLALELEPHLQPHEWQAIDHAFHANGAWSSAGGGLNGLARDRAVLGRVYELLTSMQEQYATPRLNARPSTSHTVALPPNAPATAAPHLDVVSARTRPHS